jgi:intermediate cleaving peptidase 55
LNQAQSTLARYLYGPSGDSEISKLVKSSRVKPLRPILNEMRVIKSESEVVNMRKAGGASGRAFTESMKHKFAAEKELNAFLQYQFKKKGCDTTAFVPVVAGGPVSNQPVLRPWICAQILTIAECA